MNWEEVGTLSDSARKDAAEYRIYEFVEAIEGKPYRFVLVLLCFPSINYHLKQ